MVLCLVLGEIATRNTDLIRPERNDYNRPNAPQRQYLPCNALSIEKVTGIPRETVRRKIAKLLDLGWIERLRMICILFQTNQKRYLPHLMMLNYLTLLIRFIK